MDGSRFDAISRAFADAHSRRGLTRLLLGVPLLGGLGALLGTGDETAAIDDDHGSSHRRRRRKTRHKHRHDPHRHDPHRHDPPKKHHTRHTRKPHACPVCQTRTSAGQCVADPSQNRTVCAGSGPDTAVCCNGTCCAGCCGADGSCGVCTVFVTSSEHNGNLGGLSGADGICQQLATAATLPGTYRAWLSSVDGSPSTRFRRSQHPYLRPDGQVVAINYADLTSGTLRNPIDRTEQNMPVGDQTSWTNTAPDGTAASTASDCRDWTYGGGEPAVEFGLTGVISRTDAFWTLSGQRINCAPSGLPVSGFLLYCFQQS